MTGPATTGTLAAAVVGTPALNFTIFAFFVVVTLVIAISVARKNNSTTDYYAGGRTFTGFQNGVATSGDYLSAATFLGTPGIIAIYGFDGILYSVGFIVGWLVVLLLVSEPLRNTSGPAHDGRRTRPPAEGPAGTRRRGACHPHGLPVLPARPGGSAPVSW